MGQPWDVVEVEAEAAEAAAAAAEVAEIAEAADSIVAAAEAVAVVENGSVRSFAGSGSDNPKGESAQASARERTRTGCML